MTGERPVGRTARPSMESGSSERPKGWSLPGSAARAAKLSPLRAMTGRLLVALPANRAAPPGTAMERATVALSRLGSGMSVARRASRKSLPVRPTKVNSDAPSPETSRLTGMVPPWMPM